jgi:hypothetical protein
VARSLSAVRRRHPAGRQHPRIMRTTGAVSHTRPGDPGAPAGDDQKGNGGMSTLQSLKGQRFPPLILNRVRRYRR